ncbi:MAG TPA: hypothetical protein VIQ00_11505 [Chitinophagaceae bacterium]|jgi:hypothetical protein
MNGDLKQFTNTSARAEHTGINKKARRIFAVSCFLFFLTISLAAMVVSGNGLFSDGQSDNSGTIEYDHLLRCQTEAKVKVSLAKYNGDVQLTLPENYLQYFKVNLIYPAPEKQIYSNGNIIYTFNADEDKEVNFYLEPQKTGRIKGSLLIGDNSVTVSNFIYPK